VITNDVDDKFLAQIQHVCTLSISITTILSLLKEKNICHQKRFLASRYPQNAFGERGAPTGLFWGTHSAPQTP